MTVLVTGVGGFIGFHLANKLLNSGHSVVGIDNINNYYDQSLKHARLDQLRALKSESKADFNFVQASLENQGAMAEVFDNYRPSAVVNLAAQAGVRYSIENPNAYIQSNIVGFGNILENCKKFDVSHLVYASSSSVYGGNTSLPFSESQSVDHPISVYAATKKSNELMAHTYSHLFGLPTTGLRFFTVYGPWGRPDMALFIFTKSIIEGKPISIYNNGKMSRDFTYIDDIVESVYRLIFKPATPDKSFNPDKPLPAISNCPYRVFNIGNSNPVSLMTYISEIEKCLGIKAIKNYMEIQPGDVPSTAADTLLLEDWIKFCPSTPVNVGVSKFVSWYKSFYSQ